MSEQRKIAAIRLQEKFMKISDNILGQAEIMLDITQHEHIREEGVDNVEMLIKTNPDQDFASISKIASGGELSRLTLLLKILSNTLNSRGIIIFDEIESGTSGKISQAIAEKLRTLSSYIQVISITHHPHIIQLSDHVFHVKKELIDKQTNISITSLAKKEIENEIRYIISGKKL